VTLTAELQQAIRSSWSVETIWGGDDPDVLQFYIEQFEECPAKNQCLVTALVVQDYLGGYLIRDGSRAHWYNQLPDGSFLDWTREQFGDDYEPRIPIRDDREQLLGSIKPDLRSRYELLRDRVALRMKAQPAEVG
jgi:hypothetical protein